MKKQPKLLYEAANILCWFRIIASIFLAMMPRGKLAFALLFSLAFLSDSLDGWCYRKFTKEKPYQHWFNRLPLTMDPLADFFLVAGGIIHCMRNKLVSLLLVLGLAILLLSYHSLSAHVSDKVYTIMMTGLTYVWFTMMVLALAGAWYYNCRVYWPIGLAIVMAVFYVIWGCTRVKERSIRRRG